MKDKKSNKNKVNSSEIYGLILIIIGAIFLLIELTDVLMVHIAIMFVILFGFYFIAKKSIATGLILILLATGLLFRNYLTANMPYLWAVLIILLGSFIVLKKIK